MLHERIKDLGFIIIALPCEIGVIDDAAGLAFEVSQTMENSGAESYQF